MTVLTNTSVLIGRPTSPFFSGSVRLPVAIRWILCD